MRILVTGCTGFAGSHLCDFLAELPDIELYGVKRWRSSLKNIVHLGDKIKLLDGDLTDPSAVRRVLEEAKPDFIFHLAAQSFVKGSFDQPRETMHTNIMSEINLLHGLRENLAGGMLVAGSSDEYGKVTLNDCPVNESQPLRPLSPYAVSKVAQDLLAYQYHQSYGVRVVRCRAFNHEGPRRNDVFMMSNFAKQIAQIEAGQQDPIVRVGNLEPVRDFTDVRDTVRAYWALSHQGVSGEVYNICSGVDGAYSILDVLNMLLLASTRSDIEVRVEEKRLRPSDIPYLIGDATRLQQLTGWTVSIPFKKTLADLLDYWRTEIGSSGNKKKQESVFSVLNPGHLEK